MSTKAEMQYFEGEQTRRNKDYITISRTEYDQLKKYRTMVESSKVDLRGFRKELDERDLALRKKERVIADEKYKISLRIKQFASSILKQVNDI